jgi:hypothetical protein
VNRIPISTRYDSHALKSASRSASKHHQLRVKEGLKKSVEIILDKTRKNLYYQGNGDDLDS